MYYLKSGMFIYIYIYSKNSKYSIISIKMERSINAENPVRKATMASASKGEDYNFFQIINLSPNPK